MRNYNNMFNPIRFNIGDHAYLLRSIEYTKEYNQPVTAHIVAKKVDPSEPHFGSLFDIKKVIYNDPATIVLWADGTKTVVKCREDDVYDEQTGLLLCMAKKMYGNDGKFNNVLRKWMPEEEEEDEYPLFLEKWLNIPTKPTTYNFTIKTKDGAMHTLGIGSIEAASKIRLNDGSVEPFVKKETEWILCSERLPEKTGQYLVSVRLFDGCEKTTTDGFENGQWGNEYVDHIAWMQLPEVYKGE